MNEGVPKIKAPKISDERWKVIASHIENGLDHPDTQKFFLDWAVQRESLAKNENSGRVSIVSNLGLSEERLEAGDIDGSIEFLEAALVQAHKENKKELLHEIMKRMEEIVKGE